MGHTGHGVVSMSNSASYSTFEGVIVTMAQMLQLPGEND